MSNDKFVPSGTVIGAKVIDADTVRDAERYRWIKEHARHIEIETVKQLFGMGPTDLDRVIDVAMREPQEEKS